MVLTVVLLGEGSNDDTTSLDVRSNVKGKGIELKTDFNPTVLVELYTKSRKGSLMMKTYVQIGYEYNRKMLSKVS